MMTFTATVKRGAGKAPPVVLLTIENTRHGTRSTWRHTLTVRDLLRLLATLDGASSELIDLDQARRAVSVTDGIDEDEAIAGAAICRLLYPPADVDPIGGDEADAGGPL